MIWASCRETIQFGSQYANCNAPGLRLTSRPRGARRGPSRTSLRDVLALWLDIVDSVRQRLSALIRAFIRCYDQLPHMLTIRAEQLNEFRAHAQLKFERTLANHARQFASKHTEVLGEDGTLTVVRLAILRGAKYGFSGQGPLQLFLDLMFLLGSEFDTDLQYPWAQEILGPNGPGGEMDKADRLHAASIRYLDAVAGPANEYAIAALNALRNLDPDFIRQPDSDFHSNAIPVMRQLYPQKAAYLGVEILQAVVGRTMKECKKRSVQTIPSLWVLLFLNYSLGHAITRDPLYPWVSKALEDTRTANPEARVQQLANKARIYLERASDYLGGDKRVQV